MLLSFALLSALVASASAATAEQWRGRSIYQIITDRFALPSGADPTRCKTGDRTWCGGTWNTIRENLDYVQKMGFTAIWISPVSQNYQGPTTAYGDPYHGYWIADVTKLNDRFGTADDLKALVAEVHKRGMYIMVDVVINNVMATSTTPDYSPYLFNDATFYHQYCPVQWGNRSSEMDCWLGDTKVPLPDVDTKNPTVISSYADWIKNLVQEYQIDGLRIDAAKHVEASFWPKFCGPAGVFCIGEVFGSDFATAAEYQGPESLDSILNYPMYEALVDAFTIPGKLNTSAIADTLDKSRKAFTDLTVLGNFLENQDLPRWHNQSVDPQSLYNAMSFNFMSDGIPIVYYGQEQYFSGAGDPDNREPLWPSNYSTTTAYTLIQTLNQFRNFLVNQSNDWIKAETQVLTVSPHGIAIMKNSVISVLTNIGSPPQNGTSITVKTPFEPSTATTNILTCKQWAVGSGGTIDVEYTKGGVPVILMPSALLSGSGICGNSLTSQSGTQSGVKADNSAGVSAVLPSSYTTTFTFILSLAVAFGLNMAML